MRAPPAQECFRRIGTGTICPRMGSICFLEKRKKERISNGQEEGCYVNLRWESCFKNVRGEGKRKDSSRFDNFR